MLLTACAIQPGKRSVKVGVDHSPPFYLFQPDGSVRGLAIDVLNEAARRRNIELIWVRLENTLLDSALEARTVQLWPLVGSTPERTAKLFLTDPWLESDYAILSLRSDPVRNTAAAAGKRIAHARLRLTTTIAEQFLSKSTREVTLTRADAVESVCVGRSAGALIETRVLDALLLDRPPGCMAKVLNIATVTGATSPLSIAAVPEVSGIARDLRSAIADMAQDGSLNTTLDEWAPFSAEGTRSVWAQRAAEQNTKFFRILAALIILCAGVLGGITLRARQLQKIAQQTAQELRAAQKRFDAFMNNNPAPALIKDAKGRIVYINQATERLFNVRFQDWKGKDDYSIWPSDVADNLRRNDAAVLEANTVSQVHESVPAPDGQIREFLSIKFPFSTSADATMLGCIAIDITEQHHAEEILRASEAFNRLIMVTTQDSIEVLSNMGLILSTNEKRQAAFGEDWLLSWPLESRVAAADALEEALKGKTTEFQTGISEHGTQQRRYHVVLTPIASASAGDGAKFLAVGRDITALKRAEDRILESERRFRNMFEHAGDIIYQADVSGNFTFCNPAARRLLGYGDKDILGIHYLDLVHPDDREAAKTFYGKQVLRHRESSYYEFRCVAQDGAVRWIGQTAQLILENGVVTGFQAIARDITNSKERDRELTREATEDALTKLGNRRVFTSASAKLLNGNPERILSICLCDIDHFKTVNDQFGHAAGDEVLRRFASLLREGLRRTDIPLRLGGDEFCILFPDSSANMAAQTMDRLRERLNAISFEANGSAFSVTASFGVAQWRPGMDADQLLAVADSVLYSAKKEGRNRVLINNLAALALSLTETKLEIPLV